MPGVTDKADPGHVKKRAEADGMRPLSMADAKKGLALTFGVAQDAIEITIRG